MNLKVKEIAEKMGIKNAKQLRDITGLGMGTCYQLWDCSAKGIQFDTLNTLCNTLKAGPALLIDYTPDAKLPSSEPSSAESSTVLKSSSRPGKGKLRKAHTSNARTRG